MAHFQPWSDAVNQGPPIAKCANQPLLD